MKQLFALAALGLFAAVPVLAAEPAEGGILRKVAPHDRFAPRVRTLNGVGKLTPAEHPSLSGWGTSGLPRWQVPLGHDVSELSLYYLVFEGKNRNLEKLAEKLSGSWVAISGRVEQRSYVLVRRPGRPGEPVLKDARVVSLTVLVVDSLVEAPVRRQVKPLQPVRVTVTAEVKWFGNHYSREPNGLIRGTAKWCPWEGCYIVLNGRTVRLLDLPGDIVDHQGYRGQTFVLVGRLEQRAGGDRGVPPDVLVVESFRRV
jgi:hypothetical protein